MKTAEKNYPKKVQTVINRWQLNAKQRSQHNAKLLTPLQKVKQTGRLQDHFDISDLELMGKKFLGYATNNQSLIAATTATQIAKKSAPKMTAEQTRQIQKSNEEAVAKVTGDSIQENIVKPVTKVFTNIFSSLKWIIIAVVIVGVIILVTDVKKAIA